MATQSISNPLKRSISGGHIATIDDIAYLTKTEGSGALAYETIDKSLATKLSEIDAAISNLTGGGDSSYETRIAALEAAIQNIGTSADKITYEYTLDSGETVTTTVKAILDDLRNSLGGISNISEDVAKAKEYSQSAAASAFSAQTSQSTIVAALNEKLTEITNINNEAQSSNQKVSTKIDSLNNIAEQLAAVFDADASIEIMSRSAYNALTTVDDTKLYFLYDDPDTIDTSYSLTLSVDDSSKGTVVGTGNYTKGTTVLAVALPKSGGTFVQWNDGNTENPRAIKMESDLTLIATFE